MTEPDASRPVDLITSPERRRRDACGLAFALGFPTLVTMLYFVWLTEGPGGVQQAAYGLGKVLQFAFPAFWVLAVQRRRLGLRLPGGAGLIEGATFGLAIFGTMMALYHLWLQPSGLLDPAIEPIRQKVASFGVRGPLGFFALGAFYSMAHSLMEEYYFRWFVFGQLRRLVSVPAAIVVSSLGFMGHHVVVLGTFFGYASPLTWLFSLAVAVGGAAWAWLYHRSRSLYGPWLSHLIIDAAIYTIGYSIVGDLL